MDEAYVRTDVERRLAGVQQKGKSDQEDQLIFAGSPWMKEEYPTHLYDALGPSLLLQPDLEGSAAEQVIILEDADLQPSQQSAAGSEVSLAKWQAAVQPRVDPMVIPEEVADSSVMYVKSSAAVKWRPLTLTDTTTGTLNWRCVMSTEPLKRSSQVKFTPRKWQSNPRKKR